MAITDQDLIILASNYSITNWGFDLKDLSLEYIDPNTGEKIEIKNITTEQYKNLLQKM